MDGNIFNSKGIYVGVHCRYHRVRSDTRNKYSLGVQVWHARQSITPSKHSSRNNVHCRNADRIRYRRIALAAATRMVMRWLARMRNEKLI